MPINMTFVHTRLANLRWQEEQEKPAYVRSRKKNKIYKKLTSDQIEEIISITDALYFDLHGEATELFGELQMLGWPQTRNKKIMALEKRYIYRYADDWLTED